VTAAHLQQMSMVIVVPVAMMAAALTWLLRRVGGCQLPNGRQIWKQDN
jgi:hypothetical protein